MRTLVIGAGAVGVPYARHLALGGAEVTFLAKEKYAEDLRAGMTVYPLNERTERVPVRFEGYDVVTTAAEVAATRWDQAWLCVSSTALRGPWLEPVLGALGPETTLITLQPGARDREHLLARWPAERLVTGLITLISWQAPLAGEDAPEPGVAYWFPPLSKLPFAGAAERVAPIVATLKAGGARAAHAGEAQAVGGSPMSAVMMAYITALEGASWSLDALRRSPLRRLAATAARQAMKAIAAYRGDGPPLGRMFVRPWVVMAGLRVARARTPFPFEAYLEYHFGKVGDQTRAMMRGYIELGEAHGVTTDAVRALGDAVWGGGWEATTIAV